MKYKGPLVDGISQTLVGRILQDPYQAYLYLGLGLEQPSTPEPNLVWGVGGHIGLEHLIRDPRRIHELPPERWDEVQEIITDHLEDEFPGFTPTYPLSIINMLKIYNDTYKEGVPFETEVVFAQHYETRNKNPVLLRGKFDGINKDTNTLIEHKCKGKINADQTKLEIPHDFQVLLYSHVSGCRNIIYDLIRIPDTQWSLPPRLANQRPSAYIKSLYESKNWGDFPIHTKRSLWMQQIHTYIDEEQFEHGMDTMINPILDLVCMWYYHCSDSNFDWQNPNHYNHLFHRRPIRHFDPMLTIDYKGPFWKVITGGLELDQLQPVERFFPELA